MAKLRITLVKSGNGYSPDQIRTLQTLGLKTFTSECSQRGFSFSQRSGYESETSSYGRGRNKCSKMNYTRLRVLAKIESV